MRKLLLFCLIFLGACTANTKANEGLIRVYDNTIYQNVKPMLLADFTKHGILTEELPSFNPIALFEKEWGFKTGRELYKKLSLSFQYPSIEESKYWTFQNSKEEYTETNMYSHGFIVEHGLQKITVSLLGDLDWDKNSTLDWLIYCRLEEKRTQNKITQNDARKAREYILILTDRNGEYWHATPIVIRDLVLYTNSQESKIYRNLTKQKLKALEPSLAIDFEAGQEQIIDTSTNSKTTQNTDTLKEHSLSE